MKETKKGGIKSFFSALFTRIKNVNKKVYASILLVVLAVVIALVSVLAINHFNGPTRLVNRYIDSINEQDAEAFLSCFEPEIRKTLEANINSAGGGKEFFQQNYAQTFTGETGYESFGDNVQIIVSDEKSTQQEWEGDLFRGHNLTEKNASAVATVSCVLTTKGSLREEAQQVEIICVKISGTWYLLT